MSIRPLTRLLACLVLLWPLLARAADISVVGLFPGKAVLVVNGAAPKTYSVGARVTDGVRLVNVDGASATIEASGRRHVIAIGEHVNPRGARGNASVTLHANSQGHFIAEGRINGSAVRMLVDTGATMIALSADEAKRLGINYRAGRPGRVSTANGPVPVHLVKLDSVRIGDIELHQVDAVVQEAGLPFALLGMSFLNRTEMRREGRQMILTKRY
jgi:aspartyl protease family protein